MNMNLLADRWLRIQRQDGNEEKVAPYQLTTGYGNNPIIDVWAPRPDLRNALYQMLIGIVQVAAMPETEEDWIDQWEEPPDESWLKEEFLHFQGCFEIDSAGPAFMQDFSALNVPGQSLDNLFIDLPANGHFHKKNSPIRISPYWAAVSLYALQTFAPAGGRGHRVGLRGGGPLSTLVIPNKGSRSATLWEKLWLNVLSKEEADSLSGDIRKSEPGAIFPWMAPTRTSEKSGSETLPGHGHPFQMYFGMPRRIRFEFHDVDEANGVCALSGEPVSRLTDSYKTRHAGINYAGPWLHPLNAYIRDPKNPAEPPLSVKGKQFPGGVGYRHWLGLALNKENQIPAKVVQLLNQSECRREIVARRGARIWACGYDMDNMKARCWHESQLPVYPLPPKESISIRDRVECLIAAASEAAQNLRTCVKAAWFRRPKEVKGDMSFLDNAFWQETEGPFYDGLSRLVGDVADTKQVGAVARDWERTIRRKAEDLFDRWALAEQEDGLDMKRIVKARNELRKWLAHGKGMKELKNMQTYGEQEEVGHE
jgi:CRISPR system Cascade subunit CasA